MNWVHFDRDLGAGQQLPPVRRCVLTQIAASADKFRPPAVAVGYLRFASGDKHSPTFTVPGVGGEVVAWCDCLGDDFKAPLWLL